MGLAYNSNVVKDGLVFHTDNDNQKSWRGKPTINWITDQNAVPQMSYAKHNYTTDATWLANHPDAIIGYNMAGGALGSYVNTGVNSGNWQVTHHGHWQYDNILKKPVVVMNDVDAQWKAKSFSMGRSFNDIGLAVGDTYSISWLQWVDKIDKAAQTGVYMRNTSGTWGFHAGQSRSQSSGFNTKIRTWQRVYATFTVPSNMNMASTLSIYMYGFYGGRGVVKIADVQFEIGSDSGFVDPRKYIGSNRSQRTPTQALVDLTGNNIIDLTSTNINYDPGNKLRYAASIVDTGLFSGRDVSAQPLTIEAWVRSNDTAANRMWVDVGSNGNGQRLYSGLIYPGVNSTGIQSQTWGSGATPQDTNWHHQAIVLDGSTATMYCDGVAVLTKNYTTYTLPGSIRFGGRSGYFWNGEINMTRIYDRNLSADEVLRNFTSSRKRYGV